ncbi:MAG: hypothetical protein KF708_14485 [Pirellulales bacterium]|nr:hypothetical protein [Pirellulales bacterium]
MEVCTARASAAVVQRVPLSAIEGFVQWQRGVTEEVEKFPGYDGTDIYPPMGGGEGDWVTLLHFEDHESLEKWLDSPERARWVEKLRATVGDFELKKLEGGFAEWFRGATAAAGKSPPGWKMALTVLFGLYPTVMLLTIFVTPYVSSLGMAFSMLVGNALSVSLLQWLIMPTLTRLLIPWLEADPQRGRLLTYAGLVGLVSLLFVMGFLFRPVTG